MKRLYKAGVAVMLAACISFAGMSATAFAGEPEGEEESVSWETISVVPEKTLYAYTGKAITPSVTVGLEGATLVEGTDYEVSYSKNTNVGTAQVTVTGLGKYDGQSASAGFDISKASISYNANGKSSVSNGKTAGTTTGSKKITKISAKVSTGKFTGSVKYRIAQVDKSWSSWKTAGDATSSASKAGRIIEFKLTGQLAKYYNVYYRANVTNYGWMGWTKNGKKAGAWGIRSVNLRGYQVVLVPKGTGAPGKTDMSYAKIVKNNDGDGKIMVNKSAAALNAHMSNFDKIVAKIYANKIKNTSSPTSYIIVVSTDYNRVGIFKGSKGKWKLADMWPCGTGRAATPTVKGTYYIGEKGYAFDTKGNDGTCYYYSEISGNYLFHSWITKLHVRTIEKYKPQLSRNISHGCVRLHMDQAKWMQDHIPYSTKIKIYGSV